MLVWELSPTIDMVLLTSLSNEDEDFDDETTPSAQYIFHARSQYTVYEYVQNVSVTYSI